MTRLIGRCVCTVTVAEQGVPLLIAIASPLGDDHEKPSCAPGLRISSAYTANGAPWPPSCSASREFPSTRTIASGVAGNCDTYVTVPLMKPYSSRGALDGDRKSVV